MLMSRFWMNRQSQISDFSGRLSSVLRKFIETIANLNLENGPTQLEDAKTAYKEGKGLGMAGKFNRELKKLQKKIVYSRKTQDRGSAVYTHFGTSECVKDEYTSTVFSGYLASSPRNYTGAGYNFLCFPKIAKGSIQDGLEGHTSMVAGVKYGLLETKPSQINVVDRVLKGVVCSVCLVKQRPNIHTFLGQSECPDGSDWILQYSGFIMSSIDASRSQNICMDSKLEYHQDSDPGYLDQSLSFVLTDRDERNEFIPCAVCSK